MELTDLSLPKKSKQAAVQEVECDVPEFPYGLQLRFEKEQVALMPSLKVFKVGDKVSIVAEATVSMIRQRDMQNEESEYCVEMQIEKCSASPKEVKPPEQMSPGEYRLAREGKVVV